MIDYDSFSRCHPMDIFFRFSRGSKRVKHLISIMSCNSRSEIEFGLNNFSITRKCESNYHTKIHKTLLGKKNILPVLSDNFMLEMRLLCFACFNSALYLVTLKTFCY